MVVNSSVVHNGSKETFLSLLDDVVAHDLNQCQRQTGKPAFAEFMRHMNRCYRETRADWLRQVCPKDPI